MGSRDPRRRAARYRGLRQARSGGVLRCAWLRPTTTYDLLWDDLRYPPKAILGTAYELATGQRLASADFEGGKSGAVRVLERLGFTVTLRTR